MKSSIAKSISSIALVLTTFTAAHAANDSPFPTAGKELPDPLPSTIQYFDQRANRGDTNLGGQGSPFPVGIEENTGWYSPETMQYLEQRDRAIANELKGRPPSRRFDYIPRSNARGESPAIQ